MNQSHASPSDTFTALDIHFARLMEKLSGRPDPSLLLAAALASNAVQEGHVCVDLAAYAGQTLTFANPPAATREWPDLAAWIETLAATPVVGSSGDCRPLILCGTRLYLYRYHNYERRFVAALQKRTASEPTPFDAQRAAMYLSQLFPEKAEGVNWQKAAAAIALLKNFSVISGGPGTGKTTTVIRIAALLAMLSPNKKLRMALAAPTGKAAARLEESIARHLPSLNCAPEVAVMVPTTASTIHMLLGTIPDSPYFRHNGNNPLPLDVAIIDEASMVDLPLMVKLLDAIPPEARVLLLGDKDQLASVEAGALLGDLCDTGAEHGYSPGLCASVKNLMPEFSLSGAHEPPIADALITLRENYRFATLSGIGTVSRLVNDGKADEVIACLKSPGSDDCTWWVPPSYGALAERLLNLAKGTMADYLRKSGPQEALASLAKFRILCAVRNGPLGVTAVNRMVESILASSGAIAAGKPYYSGRPIIITRNDYAVELYNGDMGIVLPDDQGTPKAFFMRNKAEVFSVPINRLPPHETAFAMTVHKAQGSEFEQTVIILPAQPSAVVTRELLYTGITRSRKRCELWCTEEMLRLAVATRTTRTSGIKEALWKT
jgi:exodeoxyribonuclease V alpha subunit